jgi:hypothetical protein
MDICIGKEDEGEAQETERIELGLYGNEAPKTGKVLKLCGTVYSQSCT